MDLKLAFLFGIIGTIISYIIINFYVPWIFPESTMHKKMQNRLFVDKVSIPITKGRCNFNSSISEINTSNVFKDEYLYLPDSNNIKGGSQFSFSFWLNMAPGYKNNLADKIIFYRGLYLKEKSFFPDTEVRTLRQNDSPHVKCPLVKFSSLTDETRNLSLVIQFNTFKEITKTINLEEEVFSLIQSSSSNPRWYLITLSFQDYIDFTNFEKGIQFQAFINDSLVKTSNFKDDSLKVNHGNLIITPDDTKMDINSSYADLTYHNYALDIIEVQKLFNKGINNEKCTTNVTQKLPEISYNKLNLFNELQQI